MAKAHSLPTLWENIREDMGTDTSDSALGPIRLARRMLLRGDVVQSREFAEAHGCSLTVVGQAVRQLKIMGVPVEDERYQTPINGRNLWVKRYRVPAGSPMPTEESVIAYAQAEQDDQAHKRKMQRQREARAVAKAQREASTVRATNTATAVEAAPEPASAPRERPSGNNLPALPGLGQVVTVFAMALDEDGESITIGLRNGEHSWLTRLVGQAER